MESPVVQAAFNIVELVAAVVNESRATDREKAPCGGAEFYARRMTNRSFSLTTGDLYMDANNEQNGDLTVYGFNVTTLSLQVSQVILNYLKNDFKLNYFHGKIRNDFPKQEENWFRLVVGAFFFLKNNTWFEHWNKNHKMK